MFCTFILEMIPLKYTTAKTMKKLFLILLTVLTVVSCGKKEQETEQIAIISTPYGEISLILYDDTPLHKENFLKLASEGFYDSTTFHRVIPGFMIQGGDPNSLDDDPMNDGQGGPGYTVDAEIMDTYMHKKGALAAARLSDRQNPERKSSGSQFYIVHGREVQDAELEQVMFRVNNDRRKDLIGKYLADEQHAEIRERLQYYNQRQITDSLRALLLEVEASALAGFEEWEYTPEQRSAYQSIGGYPALDLNYTIFGEVLSGLNVVDSIAVQDRNPANRPHTDIIMTVRVDSLTKEQITARYGYTFQ